MVQNICLIQFMAILTFKKAAPLRGSLSKSPDVFKDLKGNCMRHKRRYGVTDLCELWGF